MLIGNCPLVMAWKMGPLPEMNCGSTSSPCWVKRPCSSAIQNGSVAPVTGVYGTASLYGSGDAAGADVAAGGVLAPAQPTSHRALSSAATGRTDRGAARRIGGETAPTPHGRAMGARHQSRSRSLLIRVRTIPSECGAAAATWLPPGYTACPYGCSGRP